MTGWRLAARWWIAAGNWRLHDQKNSFTNGPKTRDGERGGLSECRGGKRGKKEDSFQGEVEGTGTGKCEEKGGFQGLAAFRPDGKRQGPARTGGGLLALTGVRAVPPGVLERGRATGSMEHSTGSAESHGSRQEFAALDFPFPSVFRNNRLSESCAVFKIETTFQLLYCVLMLRFSSSNLSSSHQWSVVAAPRPSWPPTHSAPSPKSTTSQGAHCRPPSLATCSGISCPSSLGLRF
jgi:hypothetical protein